VKPIVRTARILDLDSLLVIEEVCFDSDRLSKKSMRHLVSKGSCDFLVVEMRKVVAAYGLVFERKNSKTVRLYSLAVHPDFRDQHLGSLLLRGLEKRAKSRKKLHMVLEVKTTNEKAITLYERYGYKAYKKIPRYYEDGSSALRMIKTL